MDITTNNTIYRFPILKNAEIIDCLSEAGIEINEGELVEPHRHKEKVKQVFFSLVELGLGKTKDSFSQTPSSEMKYIQSLPESSAPLHTESFSSLKFFSACQKFMHVCGNSDGFSFNDLGAPDKKRFKRQLSAAINFIKFREDRLVLYAELHDQREELLQGLQEVNQEQQNLEREYQEVQGEAERRWNDLKEIDTDCAEMEGEIGKKNKLQRSLRNDSEDLKRMANRLKDEIDTAQLAWQEMDAEERKLLTNVVDSPDELKVQIAQLNVALAQEKSRLREAEGEAKVAESRVKNVGRASSDVGNATKLVEELLEEKEKFGKLEEEVIEVQMEIESNREQVKRLEDKRKEHQAELEQIEHETDDNRQESKRQMQDVQLSLRDVNAQLFAVEKDRRDAKATLEQHEADIKVIQTIIEEEQAKADDEFENILSNYKKMEKALLERQERFDATIGV